MARLRARIVAQNDEGDARAGAVVRIYQPGTGSLAGVGLTTGTPFIASLYLVPVGGAPVSPVFVADSNGEVVFWTDARSRYDVGIELGTTARLVQYEGFELDPADVPFPLGANDVATVHIQNNAITNDKMADNSVGAAEIINLSVGTDELADNAVTNAKMADNSVNTAELVDNAVTQAKMNDSSVGRAELVANAVTTRPAVIASSTDPVLTAPLGADPVAFLDPVISGFVTTGGDIYVWASAVVGGTTAGAIISLYVRVDAGGWTQIGYVSPPSGNRYALSGFAKFTVAAGTHQITLGGYVNAGSATYYGSGGERRLMAIEVAR